MEGHQIAARDEIRVVATIHSKHHGGASEADNCA